MGQRKWMFTLRNTGHYDNHCKKILSPLHIKLGLMKIFVKAMNKTKAAFNMCRINFQALWSKYKERLLLLVSRFVIFIWMKKLTILRGKTALKAFKLVATNFLGNEKAENYRKRVEDLLKAYKQLEYNMSLKIHFLDSYLDFPFKTVVLWVVSMVNDFLKTLQQERKSIRAGEVHQCWLIIVGLWPELIILQDTKDKLRTDMWLLNNCACIYTSEKSFWLYFIQFTHIVPSWCVCILLLLPK